MYNKAYLSYLPHYMQRIREIRALAEIIDPYLESAESENDNILREGIISTAESVGLEMWEELLGLPHSGSVQSRREKILAFLAGCAPYTFSAVLNALKAICGADMVKMNYGESEYTLQVWIKPAAMGSLDAVKGLLERALPANMVYYIMTDYTTHGEISAKRHRELAAFTHDGIRQGQADTRT